MSHCLAALSVRHFSSLILHYTGQTPMQWIHLFIIGQAKHLIPHEDAIGGWISG